jgi:hypothetical protein
MQRLCRDYGLVLTVGITLAALAGCGGGKKKVEATPSPSEGGGESKSPEFDYEKFAPLPKVMTEVTLPMLLDENGVVELPCFVTQELEPVVGGIDFKALVEKNNKSVRDLIVEWFIDDVGPTSLSMSDTETWDVEVGNLTVMEVDSDKLRFAEDQECITDETGWLSDGTRAVTTVIGAKFFEFTTKQPLNITIQEDMVDTCKEKEIAIESKAIGLYKPSLDEGGDQKLNKEGELMYIGPGGVEISEKDMPPESERAMKDWSLEVKKPLYFAFQTIPSDSWTRENKKKTCDTFLVWGDVTPRAPECDELKNVTFTAEKKGDDLAIEITYNDKSQDLTTPFGTTQKVALGDRIILWLNVKKLEEGVLIRTNSVTIGAE